MSVYVLYKESGEIVGIMNSQNEDMVEMTAEGNQCLFAAYSGQDFSVQDNYFENGEVLPKGDYELDSLPLPCKIMIENQVYDCDTQPVFEFDAPGLYEISVDAGPKYIKKVFIYDNQP